MYLIKKVSEISGVSVRTLHHYDDIGLLSPRKEKNGYRYYTDENMSTLQSILFYKYLGFSLKQIKYLLITGDDDLLIHFKNQLELMQKEKARLLTLIETLKKTIEANERRMNMSTEEKFKGFMFEDNNKYKEAAIEAYGREVIENSTLKQKGKEKEIADSFNNIFFAFADNMAKGLQATEKENLSLAKELHEHICKYAFDCSIDVFSKIGCVYVQNEEFKNNIDKFGAGTAKYVYAIAKYVSES